MSCWRHAIILALSANVFLWQTGCSMFVGSKQSLGVTCSELEAQIFVDGEFAGTGAGTVSVSRDETHTIMARLGDRVAVRSVGKGFSTTGILDIVGGLFWLVPFVGLAFPGAYSLEEDNVALLLPPATQS